MNEQNDREMVQQSYVIRKLLENLQASEQQSKWTKKSMNASHRQLVQLSNIVGSLFLNFVHHFAERGFKPQSPIESLFLVATNGLQETDQHQIYGSILTKMKLPLFMAAVAAEVNKVVAVPLALTLSLSMPESIFCSY